MRLPRSLSFFFFFNDTATTEIYTLSLHDALPISSETRVDPVGSVDRTPGTARSAAGSRDRKSTRLNSSHDQISYAVFCLKKKKNKEPYSATKYTGGGRHRRVRSHKTQGCSRCSTI